MQLNKSQAQVVKNAIQSWNKSNVIDKKTAETLTSTIKVIPFDWNRLAKYSIWTALICSFIALAALVSDQILMRLLEYIFNASAIIKFLSFTVIAELLFYYGDKRKKRFRHKVYSNEAIIVFGIAATAAAIYQLGLAFSLQTEDMRYLLFFACIIYGLIGYYYRSNIIWLFALISLGGWFGAETGYLSDWGSYYFGMNYPLRFVLFGAILTFLALSAEEQNWCKKLQKTTLIVGLFYLFFALWILSIFGDHSDLKGWYEVKQIELFQWSILFALVAIGAIVHGLRYDNGITKGFGITFLFINLYTRFFEYFWQPLHKAVFFAILAASFWYIGTRAEKIWHIGEKSGNYPFK